MWNYGYVTSPFKDYGIKTVTVEYGITSIGDYVFRGCCGMTELTLPNSVRSIGKYAFDSCTGLTNLALPNSLTSIGDSAFAGCTGLETITVGSGNSRYDSRDNCNSIIDTETNTLIVGCKNSVIPNSITSIGDSAFYDCSELTELTLPNSVTSIGYSAFYGCGGLTELALPNSLTSIEQSAFYGCGGLTELTLPNSLTEIGIFAFVGCTGLETITVGSGNSRYDSRDNCNSIIETGTNSLIVGCKNSVIPNSVTSIGYSAFAGCTGLTRLTLPNSVTSIRRSAFAGCTGLTELTLPNSVTSIEDYAFVDCSGLEKITVDGGNKRYDSRDNCNSIIDTETNTLIAGCKNSVIPNSVASIGNEAFRGCSGLTKLTLPDGVTSIGNYAFDSCSGLTKLILPNSVRSIGDYAFRGCSGLTELILPNSVRSIGDYAFVDCSDLSKITSLAGIPPVCGSGVFDGVNKTNCGLIIPGGSVAAYKQAEGWKEFSNIRLLAAISGRCGDSITWTLDDSLNLTLSGSGEMWNYNRKDLPFKDYGIKTVTIGDGITSIGDYAFVYCSGLTELTLPSSVTGIGNSAFEGCSGVTELTLPSSVTSIGESAFQGCSGMTELTLPNSLTEIGKYAFRGCSGLTELTLPNSITSIGDYAFYSCRGLTELTLSNSLTSIGKYAFKGCIGLEKITSLAEIPPMCGRGVFDGVNKTNCELIVPEGSVAAYKQAEVWNEFSNIWGFPGVDVTEADGNTIRVIGNQIEISGDFTSVEVYGINGALIYKGKDNVVTVPSAGIYLVHVADKTRKIVVE